MYQPKADASVAAAWGFVGSIEADPVEIYPDNLASFELFNAMSTQWRISAMGSVTGLDYSALPAVMHMQSIKHREQSDRFKDLQVMEQAALETMRDKRNE
jgi:Phage related hypothetical protein (DUF1799)